jgi:hypothetical protein
LPKPGEVEKIDSEYVRCGTASIFMLTEPLGGWRHVAALKSRKRRDFAEMIKKSTKNIILMQNESFW